MAPMKFLTSMNLTWQSKWRDTEIYFWKKLQDDFSSKTNVFSPKATVGCLAGDIELVAGSEVRPRARGTDRSVLLFGRKVRGPWRLVWLAFERESVVCPSRGRDSWWTGGLGESRFDSEAPLSGDRWRRGPIGGSVQLLRGRVRPVRVIALWRRWSETCCMNSEKKVPSNFVDRFT